MLAVMNYTRHFGTDLKGKISSEFSFTIFIAELFLN